MKAFVTGGSGFVGGALVRRLLPEGIEVTALVRSISKPGRLAGLPVRLVEGDLSDPARLAEGMQGCEWVFHVAALYAYWGHTWQEFLDSNVEGTRHVLEAARRTGAQRVVHTSSIAVLASVPPGQMADEDTPTRLEDLDGFYKRSKFLAEEVVREFAAAGLPVVTVNPSAPIGAGDWKPTPTGRIIVRFLNGQMPAYVPSRQNMVGVDDVAAGHLLAAQKGRVGQRYILGGENFTLKDFLDLVAEVSGRPKVTRQIPYSIALGWGYLDSALGRLIKGHDPMATPEAVRIGKVHSHYDSSKAVRELGYAPRPLREAVRQAVEWYRENGYVK